MSEDVVPSRTIRLEDLFPIDPRHAYDDIIRDAAERYDLDPVLIKAVMQAESAFDALAISPVGAMGLMQLMPDVAAELGVDDPMDPRQNIMGGSLYLKRLLDSHRGNVRLALASYNAGPGAVAKYGAIPPFKETRDYVKKITGLLADARANSD
jgi:soluble lytic murein transglycosylase-like protein